MAPPLIFFPPVTWQTQTHTKADASAGIYKHPLKLILLEIIAFFLRCSVHVEEKSWHRDTIKNDQSGMTFAFRLQPTILLAFRLIRALTHS
jgi:hypothetical protein